MATTTGGHTPLAAFVLPGRTTALRFGVLAALSPGRGRRRRGGREGGREGGSGDHGDGDVPIDGRQGGHIFACVSLLRWRGG